MKPDEQHQHTLKDEHGTMPLWVRPRGAGPMQSPVREVMGVAVSIASMPAAAATAAEALGSETGVGVVIAHVDVPAATRPGTSWWAPQKAAELAEVIARAAAMCRRINALHARSEPTARELAEKAGVNLASDDEKGFPA